jgi:hypothetical protein
MLVDELPYQITTKARTAEGFGLSFIEVHSSEDGDISSSLFFPKPGVDDVIIGAGW